MLLVALPACTYELDVMIMHADMRRAEIPEEAHMRYRAEAGRYPVGEFDAITQAYDIHIRTGPAKQTVAYESSYQVSLDTGFLRRLRHFVDQESFLRGALNIHGLQK
jgi:hypothetical protein